LQFNPDVKPLDPVVVDGSPTLHTTNAMKFLAHLFQKNRTWAAEQTREDPAFFERLCALQNPDYLWIGCSDSRVPANAIVGLAPGELFVHRNIANVVPADDRNALSVITYAVEELGVEHIIVCGHYRCGGVQAALSGGTTGVVHDWLAHVRDVADTHADELTALADDAARWNRLCELNVARQVRTVAALDVVTRAWHDGRPLAIHGWIYDLHDGLLRDLELTVGTVASALGGGAAG
jgi:carbonic anhydrase